MQPMMPQQQTPQGPPLPSAPFQGDAESSYRALIDKGDFSQQPINTLQRANRTKSLLSGGFGRPQFPPQQQAPSMFPLGPQQQQQQQLPPPQPFGGFMPGAAPQHQQPPPLQTSPFAMFPPRPNGNFFPPPAAGGFGGFGSAGFGGAGGLGSAPMGGGNGYPYSWNPYRRSSPTRSRRSRSRHRHRSSSKHQKKWYELSRKSRRSRTGPAVGWWNTQPQRSRSRSRSRSSSGSRSRSTSRSRSRSSSRSSSASSCSTCSGRSVTSRRERHRRRRQDLSALQRKIILGTIREYMPEKNMHDVVYQDIISQMEHLEKHNYRLPKEYDKHKHDISDNEIRLYEQQMQRDKTRDFKKVSNMISFSATCLSQFCEFMQVDWIKTKHLPKVIREAIKEGEFEECMEGIGSYMRGSIFDHPIFSTVLKFVEKVGEAHNNEMEEEQEKLEEEEERRERRHADSLRQLNKLRQDPATALAGVPPPPSSRRRAAASASASETEEPSNKSMASSATGYSSASAATAASATSDASTAISSATSASDQSRQKKMK